MRSELRALWAAGGSGGRRRPKQRAQERARLQIGGRARGEERTLNMPFIFVTLEVSKLSGWLNDDAPCRESKGGHAVCMGRGMRVGRHEAAGDRGASSVYRAGLDCRSGAGHGEEHTKNIHHIFVTLEVSKLSGWLKTDAPCRYSNGGMRCGARCIYTGRQARWHTQRVYRAGLGYR